MKPQVRVRHRERRQLSRGAFRQQSDELNTLLRPSIEARQDDAKDRAIISGYSSIFDNWYQVGSRVWGFQERVDSKAFNETLKRGPERIGLFNHNLDFPLGSTESGTLTDGTDKRGLTYSLDVSLDSPQVQSVVVAIREGNVRGASFSFEVLEDEWKFDRGTGEDFRTLTRVMLFEHGPVTLPASPDTTADVEAASSDRGEPDSKLESIAIKVLRAYPLTPEEAEAVASDTAEFSRVVSELHRERLSIREDKPDEIELDVGALDALLAEADALSLETHLAPQ